MAELAIYVIPPEYWGGAAPKAKRPVTAPVAGSMVPQAPSPKARLKPTAVFLIVMGALFVLVIAGASWYFTRSLRTPRPAPAPEAPPSAVAPTPEPAPAPPVPPPAPPVIPVEPEPTPPPPLPTEDAESDGLTGVEEALYGTDKTRPDTDSDGFLDGHELFHLYNPSGIAPERLEATSFVRRAQNDALGYSLLIPTAWSFEPDLEDLNSMQIKDVSGTLVVTVRVLPNTERLALQQWFATSGRIEGVSPESLSPWLSNKAGLEGWLTPDGRQVYLVRESSVMVVSYNAEATAAYKRTLEMLVNSVR